jgi:O-antigen/teichoic acid export membrane protein
LSLANAAGIATSVITSVIAARALGPAGRGDLAVLLLWPSLITSLLDSGLTDAVTSRTAQGREAFWGGIRSAGVLGVLGLLGGLAAVHLALTATQAHLRNPALWALGFIPLSLLSCVPLGTLAGSGRFRTLAAVQVGSALLYLASLATLAMCDGATVAAVLSVTVAMRAIPLVVVGRSSLRTRAGVAPSAIREVLRAAARFQLPRIATVLACNVDRVAVAWMLSQADIGYWQVAVSLGNVVPFVGQAIAQEVFATGSRGAGGEPLLAVRHHVRRAVAATALFAIVGVAAAPVVIPALFGRVFRESTVPAALAIIAGVPSAACFVLQAAMKSRGLNLRAALSEALGASVVAVVALLSVPRVGLVGLAAGVMLGRAASAAASYYGLHTSNQPPKPSVTVGQDMSPG